MLRGYACACCLVAVLRLVVFVDVVPTGPSSLLLSDDDEIAGDTFLCQSPPVALAMLRRGLDIGIMR